VTREVRYGRLWTEQELRLLPTPPQLLSLSALPKTVRSKILILAVVLASGTGLAHVSNRHAGLFRPFRTTLAFATLGSVSATPGTISFQANNPDSGRVSGLSPGNLTWMVLGGSHLNNWTLNVQAGSSAFVGCPTIPTSAIQVNCGTATASGSGGTGVCRGSFPLSTTGQQIAGGTEGDGTNPYSVSVNFSLAESWRYVAGSSCTISLTYSVNAP
jgi:hypothetical protein